ncbi:MAG TPA: hydroxysqualene dehydroxylase HpnE [Actinomycetota bacterium]|nr:hydroxysqualene dehydroxylase HpnE [Actinomycetota bacterium]
MTPEPRIVVVGGGLAGLSAALACADGGARVTLLEARPRLGGATFSFQREGLWVDNGQHVFLRCCTAYRGFLARIGAEGLTFLQRRLAIPVVAPDGTSGWLRRGGLPAPLHLAGALARYPFLRPIERIRAARAALALSRLDPSSEALDRRTFGEWLADRRQSPAAMESLWNLIALPTLNLPAEDASLALAVKVFRTGLLTRRDAADVGYAKAPLSQVHAQSAGRALAAAAATVHLRAPVRRVEALPGGSFEVQGAAGSVEADAVIVAAPHDRVTELLPPGALQHHTDLAGLGASPIVNVHVVYDRPVMDVPFVAGVRTPVQWVFDRTESSGLERGQYLAVSLSGAEQEIAERTEDLRERFVPALDALFPRAHGARVEAFFVTREHAATFRQAPGTRVLRPGPPTKLSGLYLAGAWTDTGWPATMEGAVRSGLAAARAALVGAGRTRRLPEVVAA